MARIRTIKPEFCLSESMGRVSRDAQLLYVKSWTIVDDAGRARGSSRMLASLLYPYDDQAPKLIDGWLEELEREGCVRRYEVDGDTYLDIPKWLKHQKIDKPSQSRLPAFEEGSPIVAKPREGSAPDLGPVPRTKDHGLGPRIEERTNAARSEQAELLEPISKQKRRKASHPLPEDWKLSDELWKYGTGLGLRGEKLAEEEGNIKLWCRQEDHRCVDRDAFVQRWLRRTAKRERPPRANGVDAYDDFLNGSAT